MKEYIEREATIKAVCDSSAHTCDLKNCFHGCQEAQAILAIPADDVVPVVRCKDCDSYNKSEGLCEAFEFYQEENGYCSYGERKDGDGNGV